MFLSDELELELPAGSATKPARACRPSANGEVGEQLQDPSPPTVVEQIALPPSLTVMVALASAVPEILGWFIKSSDPSEGVDITGASGATES